MNCLIVDDQAVFRAVLKKLITLDPSLFLVGECTNAAEAHQIILNNDIDIIFLDIEMPRMSGIELARLLEGKNPMIIFTTSQIDYAIEAFDLNVVDFLTKPIGSVRFLKAVQKARNLIKTKKQAANEADEFVFIRDSNIIKRIKLSDILYFEAKGDYIKIFLSNTNYSIHSSLKSVEQKLPENTFFKVHRSFIVNLGKIDSIEGGTLIVNHTMIPVSDTYRPLLNKRMQIL
ncbi:LytTR family DNA-binding domain-containing protein [Pedobacter panaciterrae]|uniref:LytTR family DNA-binding domain-containing protein n=1 Tax=Pedobacter panaciterrae TaxID=363849 RepID=A0ABU8NPM2_9SPHI